MAKKETNTPTLEQISAIVSALSAEEVAKLNAGALTIADILKAHPGLATKLANAAPASEDDKDAEIASLKAQLKAAKKGKKDEEEDDDDEDDEDKDVELPIVIKTKPAKIDWTDQVVDGAVKLGLIAGGTTLGVFAGCYLFKAICGND